MSFLGDAWERYRQNRGEGRLDLKPLAEMTRASRDVAAKIWPGTYAGRFAVLGGGIVILLLLVLPWYAKGHKDKNGVVTYPNAALVNPILAGIGATLLIYAAIRQAQTASRQARIASDRHEAQTKADLQRRITESFSKAIEQLSSDKLEVRLGGIYALERISRESDDDYWTVMENLTAFVRERTQRTEVDRMTKPLDQRIAAIAYSLWEKAGKPEGRSERFWAEAVAQELVGPPPSADIAAVLTVIERRSEEHRALETQAKWDFQQAILRSAYFTDAHFERANFGGAHLEGASFYKAHLERASFYDAHLERADLSGAHLERAIFYDAHLEGALLGGAHLEGAALNDAHLEGAVLNETHLEGALLGGAHLEGALLGRAHLEGANLGRTVGLTQSQIDQTYGNAATQLPDGLTRPAHWT